MRCPLQLCSPASVGESRSYSHPLTKLSIVFQFMGCVPCCGIQQHHLAADHVTSAGSLLGSRHCPPAFGQTRLCRTAHRSGDSLAKVCFLSRHVKATVFFYSTGLQKENAKEDWTVCARCETYRQVKPRRGRECGTS